MDGIDGRRIPRHSRQFSNAHELCQFVVSQTLKDKCEAERIPISLEAVSNARRSIFEMLHTDLLLVGFDHTTPSPLSASPPTRTMF